MHDREAAVAVVDDGSDHVGLTDWPHDRRRRLPRYRLCVRLFPRCPRLHMAVQDRRPVTFQADLRGGRAWDDRLREMLVRCPLRKVALASGGFDASALPDGSTKSVRSTLTISPAPGA